MTNDPVKVLCIEPGLFRTNLTDVVTMSKTTKMLWDRMPHEVRGDYGTEYLQKSTLGGRPTVTHFDCY